jgi:hypothetical protein
MMTSDIVNNILSIVQNLDDAEEAKEYTRIYLKALRNAGLDERLSDDWVYWNLKKVDVRFDSNNDYTGDDDITEDGETETVAISADRLSDSDLKGIVEIGISSGTLLFLNLRIQKRQQRKHADAHR